MKSDEEFFAKWGNFDNTYFDNNGILRWVANDKSVYKAGKQPK